MATTRSANQSSEDIVDSTPFLRNSGGSSDEINSSGQFFRRQSLHQAARFLRQASSRRMMREPSILVRETAAEQLEERQSDWAYSKPMVILDIIWNFSIVIVAAAILFLSWRDSPSMPLRLWIVGYALQCVLHMVCVSFEYQRRRRHREGHFFPAFSSVQQGTGSSENLNSGLMEDSEQYTTLTQLDEEGAGVTKYLESANTMFSFIWWIIGFYWVSSGGQALAQESLQLYWLCIVFLVFDVFFVVSLVALACIIGIAVCCCLPCIIALLYAVAGQEGTSKEDIEQLPKFKFQRIDDNEKLVVEVDRPLGGIMTECGTDSPTEQALSQEDAECCICLSAYDDGVELRELPCGHHFHCACVDKWLYINATCPLCKYNILKSSSSCGQEEA
ncbi:E3 ubiquitin-protein ligase family [Quillaja saponaria]|uniref:RING-type E3 ubiquitin transferase n=1 Tax=Quillaja saponaria TaxID=32244 RepID=A0AAD7L7W8_QUISA|nr:E3 ubiquitin-protein ligase family [Quillaja saponaria]